jgi:putative membrane protein insertion efficiency factor
MCIIDKIFSILTISIVKIYKFFISPLLGNNCRFLPTCSEYCIEALEKKGFFVGIFLTFKRILKCHPIKLLGAKSGFDPVEKDKLNG